MLQLLIFIYCLASITLATQIYVGSGSISDSDAVSTCSHIQEFSCINDVCDDCAGGTTSGRCRNGDNSGGTCPPGTLCNKPTAGHCLENTFCALGKHAMPSNKHFRCISVRDLNSSQPVIAYQNVDCTGPSCFMISNGEYDTWEGSNPFWNCIDTNPATAISTVPCRNAGERDQVGATPPSGLNGRFLLGQSVLVGGPSGIPISSLLCSTPLSSSVSFPPPTSTPSIAVSFSLSPTSESVTPSIPVSSYSASWTHKSSNSSSSSLSTFHRLSSSTSSVAVSFSSRPASNAILSSTSVASYSVQRSQEAASSSSILSSASISATNQSCSPEPTLRTQSLTLNILASSNSFVHMSPVPGTSTSSNRFPSSAGRSSIATISFSPTVASNLTRSYSKWLSLPTLLPSGSSSLLFLSSNKKPNMPTQQPSSDQLSSDQPRSGLATSRNPTPSSPYSSLVSSKDHSADNTSSSRISSSAQIMLPAQQSSVSQSHPSRHTSSSLKSPSFTIEKSKSSRWNAQLSSTIVPTNHSLMTLSTASTRTLMILSTDLPQLLTHQSALLSSSTKEHRPTSAIVCTCSYPTITVLV